MSKTLIVQRNIGRPSDAMRVFNTASERKLPVVLVPQNRWCCSCSYTVPSDVYCITQRFGADCDQVINGVRQLADPGLKCAPSFTQVMYCVTKQSCTYEAPVRSCRTSDNVMIDVELALVFQIGPEPQRVRDFVYKLGAARFNDLLSVAVDEAVRQLIRGARSDNVLELRGSSSGWSRRVMENLNDKFKMFGVSFTYSVIKEVRLGHVLEKLRENTTDMRCRMRDIEKQHDYQMKIINLDYERRRANLDRDYDRRLKDLENQMNVALIDRKNVNIAEESNNEVLNYELSHSTPDPPPPPTD